MVLSPESGSATVFPSPTVRTTIRFCRSNKLAAASPRRLLTLLQSQPPSTLTDRIDLLLRIPSQVDNRGRQRTMLHMQRTVPVRSQSEMVLTKVEAMWAEFLSANATPKRLTPLRLHASGYPAEPFHYQMSPHDEQTEPQRLPSPQLWLAEGNYLAAVM